MSLELVSALENLFRLDISIIKNVTGCVCRTQRRQKLLAGLWWLRVCTWTMETSALYHVWYVDDR